MVPFVLTKLLARTGLARHTPRAKRLAGPAAGCLHLFSDRVLAAPLDVLRDPGAFPAGTGGADAIDLNQPAPRADSPVSAGRLVIDRHGPPDVWGLPALRRLVADRAGLEPAARADVVVTHGATAALAATLDAFVNPGQAVVGFDPCPPVFAAAAASRRARLVRVPTGADAAGELTLDPRQLAAAVRGARLVVICDPANPTGRHFNPAAADLIAWAANRFDVPVYVDETFAEPGTPAAGRLSARPNLRHRLLVAGSVTAGFGLAAARVGWVRGPKPLVGAVALTASLAAPFVPVVCQQVALKALDADPDVLSQARAELAGRRRFAADRLANMGFAVTPPPAGFFFWIDVSHTNLTGRAFADRLAKEERVTVGPGDVFGPTGTRFIRLSVAAEDGRLREGLTRMARFVGRLTGKPPATRDVAAAPAGVDPRPPAFSRA